MTEPKIDKMKLNQMLRAGKPQVEIAQVFGVTESAISKAKKELNLNVIKNVALENAHRVVDKNLNAIGQLQKINDYANELLDALMKLQVGGAIALRTFENQGRDKSEPTAAQQMLKNSKIKAPQELMLKVMAEIRGQLKLQMEIFQCLYDMQAVQEFQDEVLTAIGEASRDVRDKILCNLNKKRAIRSVIKFD